MYITIIITIIISLVRSIRVFMLHMFQKNDNTLIILYLQFATCNIKYFALCSICYKKDLTCIVNYGTIRAWKIQRQSVW